MRNEPLAHHRAWPALDGGAAPMFDVLVRDGVTVLIANWQPLTALFRLLTDRGFRNQLLTRVTDPDVLAFFRGQFGRLSAREQAVQAGAALRRAHLLTFAPELRSSLAQVGRGLDFQDMFEGGRGLLVNLALPEADTRRLWGCLLMVLLEQTALARAARPANERGGHYLIVDEFAEFSAQSETSLTHILRQCRKFGLYLVLAHQGWSQTSYWLRGALANARVKVVFALGRDDAVTVAPTLGRIEPLAVKHAVPDARARDRTHPLFSTPAEQWEAWARAIQELPPRQAFAKRPGGQVAQVRTLDMPDPALDPARLATVEARHLDQHFRPQAAIERELAAQHAPMPATVRVRRLRPG